MDQRKLAAIYRDAHNMMRNVDGFQPQESFDELLKFLFYKEVAEERQYKDPILLKGEPDLQGRFNGSFAVSAKFIRSNFKAFVRDASPAVREIWPDAKFRMSDESLVNVYDLFMQIQLTKLDIDVRGAALREFVPPDVRKGLGIYLTPDEVVRATVEIANPASGARVLDPACGSGTFLLEVARLWQRHNIDSDQQIWGIDKNPRMLVLADLNLGHVKGLRFESNLLDTLFDLDKGRVANWYNSFDFIFTNPPFGVYLDSTVQDLSNYFTCRDGKGHNFPRQQSEIVFIEQCLRLLKPGGHLAIVLPRSVVTNYNERISGPRDYLGTQGYVEGVITLPPETFYATGTQTNTVVLFVRKYASPVETSKKVKIWIADITNCGYDSTGRSKNGGQLGELPNALRSLIKNGKSSELCRWVENEQRIKSFTNLPQYLSSDSEAPIDGVPLKDVTSLICTGRTPSRSVYTDEGLFLVKVGNLTGKGINWAARDRNFISISERTKRSKCGLIIQSGDILLTSSAHSPVYIAKKVDIVMEIPKWVGGEASLVGEVMLVRPDPKKIDPFILLGFLRHPDIMNQIQRLVRGQTAHLHPSDLGSIKIPSRLFKKSKEVEEVIKLLREEARLARLGAVLAWELDEKLEGYPIR